MSITGPRLQSARSSLGLSVDVVASDLGVSAASILQAERGAEADSAVLEKLKQFYAKRGVILEEPKPSSVSIIDEVERMSDEIEDRPGPHSDPAY